VPSPLQIATSISTALTIGLVPIFFGTMRAPLEQRVQLPAGRLDWLEKLLFLSWVPLMPLAGWLVDHWGTHQVLFIGSLLLGLSIAWLALAQTYARVLWGIAGLSLAGAFITVGGIAFMWNAGVSLCLGFVFVNLAFLLTPQLFPPLLERMTFRRAFLAVGLLCLLPAALVALVKSDPNIAPVAVPNESSFDIRFWLIALSAFLYFPLESSLQIWPRRYLAEIGFETQTIPHIIIGFWCAFLLMRFGLGLIIRPGNETWLLLTLLVLSSVVLGNLAGAYAPSSGSLGFWLVGACYGPLLPVLLGILFGLQVPRGNSGQALGIIFALSAASTLIVRPFLVAYANKNPPRALMRVMTVLGLVMAAPMVVLAVIRFAR
jgi:MFS family permease